MRLTALALAVLLAAPSGGCSVIVGGLSSAAGLMQGAARRFVLRDGHRYDADNPNSPAPAPAAEPGPEVVTYRGREYEFDPPEHLFGPSALGTFRARLLASGRLGPSAWEAMTVPQRAVFLAITNAVHSLELVDGRRASEPIESFDAVLGEGPVSLESFRVRGRYTEAADGWLGDGSATHRLTQARSRAEWRRGWGTPHGAHPGFARDRNTVGLPSVQFQFSPGDPSRRMEIDIDFEIPFLENHFSTDNSNPLAVAGDVGPDGKMTAANHYGRYFNAFGDPGFRPRGRGRPTPVTRCPRRTDGPTAPR
jgi:hypothetical protein